MINEKSTKRIRQIIGKVNLRQVPMMLVWSCIAAVGVHAQSPTMSYGEQFLPVTDQECMRRVPEAYRAEGFSPQTPSVNTTYATKNIHSAYIRCLGEPEKSRTRVIIVVGSNSNDENIPGTERVKLQGRMDQSTSGGCGLGRVWNAVENGISQIWTRRGNTNIFDAYATINGSPFTAEQTIQVTGNKVYIDRYKAADLNTCIFEGFLDANGKTASGTYRCTRFQPSSGWSATIKCD